MMIQPTLQFCKGSEATMVQLKGAKRLWNSSTDSFHVIEQLLHNDLGIGAQVR